MNVKIAGDKICFYITENDEEVASLEFKVCKRDDIHEEDGLLITSIYTNERYRNKGYATQLVYYLIDFGKNLKYKYILTDDMTEKRPPNNIYYKLGFYIKQPEWKEWKQCNIYECPDDEERLLYI